MTKVKASLLRYLPLLSFAAACAGGPTAPVDETQELETALLSMAAESNRAGDADGAEAFHGGSLALRLGIQPSEIEVQVGNDVLRYHAVVVGLVRPTSTDERVLIRTLIAWRKNEEGRPTAILQVSARTDVALFGPPTDRASLADRPGRARGQWADLVARERWFAVTGQGNVALGVMGGACPNTPAVDLQITCVTARYDLGISGGFHLAVNTDTRETRPDRLMQIITNATGVNGVVITPTP